MRINGHQNRSRRVAASHRVGVVLLLLVAHAYLLSATHYHRLKGDEQRPVHLILAVGNGSENDRGVEANSHAQCLLCRLQRSLIADLDNPPLASVALPPEFAAAAVFKTSFLSDIAHLSPAGRAPPLL